MPARMTTAVWLRGCKNAAICGGCFAVVSVVAGPGALGGVGPLIYFALAVFYTALAFGRLQIWEKGLWEYWGLLKWHKIESYEWQGDSKCTLMIQAKTVFPFLGRGALPVPMEQKKAVEKLLQAHVGPDGKSSSQS